MPKKYCLYDMHDYDGKLYGKIYADDSLYEVRKAMNEWRIATHGECELVLLAWSDTYQAYTGLEKMN